VPVHVELSYTAACKAVRFPDSKETAASWSREAHLDLDGGSLHAGRPQKVVAGLGDKDAETGRIKQHERKRNSFASSSTKVARSEWFGRVNVKIIN
jgi:hypothetical protein